MSQAPYLMMSGQPEVVCLVFRFQVAATGGAEPDFQFPAGAVKNVTRDGSAGLYTITYHEKYAAMIGAHGDVMEAVPAHDLQVKCPLAGYDAAAGTQQITVVGLDGSTAAEDVLENDWVFMTVYMARRDALAKVGPVPA